MAQRMTRKNHNNKIPSDLLSWGTEKGWHFVLSFGFGWLFSLTLAMEELT